LFVSDAITFIALVPIVYVCVLQKFLDEIDVREDHAAAAVAGEADLIEGVPT
jgi:hypothetical protein